MIQVQLKPEVEAALSAEAQARGIALDEYVKEIVEAQMSIHEENRSARENAVEAMRRFSGKHRVETGGQSIESMLHEGHKH